MDKNRKRPNTKDNSKNRTTNTRGLNKHRNGSKKGEETLKKCYQFEDSQKTHIFLTDGYPTEGEDKIEKLMEILSDDYTDK